MEYITIYMCMCIYIYDYICIDAPKNIQSLTLSANPVPSCCAGHRHSSISHWHRLGRDTLQTVLDHCLVPLDSCKESAKTVSFRYLQQVNI